MGVSGAGKTTVGMALAQRLGMDFFDADSLHSSANLTKMSEGIPLTDEDRWPWLRAVGRAVAEHHDYGVVVACSALKRVYRDVILESAPGVLFVHLTGSRDLLWQRLEERKQHFMPAALLSSQMETLEPLAADEPGFTVDIEPGRNAVLAEITETLQSLR